MDGMAFLARAQWHLNAASDTRDQQENFYLHLEAVVLTAAAVESEVNWTLWKRVLNTADAEQRRYLAEITKRFRRARIREKIEFLVQVYPSLTLTSEERDSLKTLFDLRNEAVHATPKLVEPTRLISSDSIGGVFGVYSLMRTARAFIEKLVSL